MGGDGGVIAANRKYLRQCGDCFLEEGPKEIVDQRERKQLRTQVSRPCSDVCIRRTRSIWAA